MGQEPIPVLSRTHSLKILAVSDFIDQALTQKVEENLLPPIDLIISCGDLPPEYLSFLRNRLHSPLFYVKGNHDIRYTRSNTAGCEDIHGRVLRFKTLNIMGIEGSMWYNGGPNQYTEAEMKNKLFWMGFKAFRRRPLHLVVTHAPPRHIHDREDLCHTGFEAFVRLIKKHCPEVFLHGHIHDAFEAFKDRTTQVDRTMVVNTCGHTIFEV